MIRSEDISSARLWGLLPRLITTGYYQSSRMLLADMWLSEDSAIAAAFPLQLLGNDVDVINTVQYSNHAGYRRFGGTKSTAEDVSAILDAMDSVGTMRHHRLLTGFVPGPEILKLIPGLVERMRRRDPDVVYVLDPVMGDDGRLYVSPEVVPIYRDLLLPLATIITPNWFEVETLTGVSIEDESSLREALQILHVHVKHVAISSLPLSGKRSSLTSLLAGNETSGSNTLLCIASTLDTSQASEAARTSHLDVIAIPTIPGYFSGVGDLFSALVLAHFDSQPPSETIDALGTAVWKASSTTYAILSETEKYCKTLPEEDCPPTDDEKDAADADRRIKRMRARELRIIQSQRFISSPPTQDECAQFGMRMSKHSQFWAP